MQHRLYGPQSGEYLWSGPLREEILSIPVLNDGKCSVKLKVFLSYNQGLNQARNKI